MKKFKIVLVSVLIGVVTVACASAAETMENFLCDLSKADLQIQSISIDMSLYLGWRQKDKAGMRDTSQKAIQRFGQVETALKKMNVPSQPEAQWLRDADLVICEKLIAIYQGLESKKKEEIRKSFQDFFKPYVDYQKKLQEAQKKYLPKADLTEDYKPDESIERHFLGQRAKASYKRAAQLYEKADYSEAEKIYRKLRREYASSGLLRGVLDLRITDCWVASSAKSLFCFFIRERARGIIEGLIRQNDYSPVLAEAFLKWRTITQAQRYGQLHTSEIPNDKYNRKRYEIIGVLRDYLKTHASDGWARTQLYRLLYLPNIEREGQRGNSNFKIWNQIYS